MSELDDLMSLDPLELSAQHIDQIIARMRKARADWDAGIKPKKEKGPTQSLASVVNVLTQSSPVSEEPVQKIRRF